MAAVCGLRRAWSLDNSLSQEVEALLVEARKSEDDPNLRVVIEGTLAKVLSRGK